jgi:hypothetical protein
MLRAEIGKIFDLFRVPRPPVLHANYRNYESY